MTSPIETGQDLSHYTVDYYQRDQAEFWFPRVGLLRPDQLAAICYIFGLPWNGDEGYARSGPPWRTPRRVMSIGCGEGHLEEYLEGHGIEVIGVDPSPGAQQLYRGHHLQGGVEGIETVDTVVFCESIEHLPRGLIFSIWDRLPITGVRVVITNWPSYHPLVPSSDGWDHITRIDDALYDELSTGFYVRVRRGSHLVLDR